MSKSKLVPVLRFPEFQNTDDWLPLKLSDLSKRVIEKVGEKKLTTVSITAGMGFVSQAEKFSRDISGKQYKNYIHLRKGEFSYNKGNSKKFAQGCIYKLTEFDEVAAPNAFISFKFKEKYVADFYQGYFENNVHGRQLLRYITSGARSDGLLNIKPEDFFSIVLPTPKTKTEAKKISDCLSSIGELIDLETKKLAALKLHKKGLLEKLFPLDGESIPEYRFPEFSEDWRETTLGQEVKYENGKAHEQDIDESGNYIVVNSKFISTEGQVKKHTSTANLIASTNDILMVLSDVPNGKAIAKCFFVTQGELYTVNQRICKLSATKSVSKFMYYLLDRNPYFLRFDDGVKQTNLRKDDVLDCPLFVPADTKEQEKIADCLSALDKLIELQASKINALKYYKKGLMQQIFPNSAEVKV